MGFWDYDKWPSGEPYDWGPCDRSGPYDQLDFHVDLGCGTLKKGRIGVDRYPGPGVNICMDLDKMILYGMTFAQGQDVKSPSLNLRGVAAQGLPFDNNSIESIVSHHFFEHCGEGFIRLIDECYRVLKPGGVLRAITPLFPSRAAVEDPDHKRYFMRETWETFCGAQNGDHWHESFSTPYTKARFQMIHQNYTGVPEGEDVWESVREVRATLRKWEL